MEELTDTPVLVHVEVLLFSAKEHVLVPQEDSPELVLVLVPGQDQEAVDTQAVEIVGDLDQVLEDVDHQAVEIVGDLDQDLEVVDHQAVVTVVDTDLDLGDVDL